MNKTDRAIEALERLMPPGSRRRTREVIDELAALGLGEERPDGTVVAPKTVVDARKCLGIRSVAERHVGVVGSVWWWVRDESDPPAIRFVAPR